MIKQKLIWVTFKYNLVKKSDYLFYNFHELFREKIGRDFWMVKINLVSNWKRLYFENFTNCSAYPYF